MADIDNLAALNIADHGKARPAFVASIVEKLRMPGGAFPLVVGVPGFPPGVSEKPRKWHGLITSLALNPEVIEGSAVPLTDVIVNHMVNDLVDLFVNGDVNNTEDPLLSLFDGLEKRTKWPDAFLISTEVQVRSWTETLVKEDTSEDEPLRQEFHVELTMYVAVDE